MSGRSKGGARWEFAGAVGKTGRPPRLDLPEIAFAGRSNVGKSTLINRLTRTRGLARTSRTPGRTQQINFFVQEGQVVFADLPGYGFAKVPQHIRVEWGPMVDNYLSTRETLRGVVVIVDARRGIREVDESLLELLGELGRPALVALNKIDKLKQGERVRLRRAVKAAGHDAVSVSALDGEGEKELRTRLAQLQGLG